LTSLSDGGKGSLLFGTIPVAIAACHRRKGAHEDAMAI
jgi:hypothetical protein